MVDVIIMQKFQPFTSDSLFPLVIDKSTVDPKSFHMTLNVEDAPLLQLMEGVLQSRLILTFAGR